MKIKKLHLKNIGVFDDEEIEFKPCSVKDKAEIHIFTGQNGSGKSTLLMALASAFDKHAPKFSPDFLKNSFYKRFKNSEQDLTGDISNQVLIEFDDEHNKRQIGVRYGQWFSIVQPSIFPKSELITPKWSVYPLESYIEMVSSSVNLVNALNTGLSFAAFADSGYRRIEGTKVEAIYEPKDFNPLSQSLSFIKEYSQPNQLNVNQLIANNISKSAIESARNKEKSKKFKRVLSTIEQAIFDITNWRIEFDLQTEPISLILKLNDENLDFDVLPDGLRSLISWMADLLGRVDLLKWQDDLPINEKNLILFLDEIEVHLHPAWQRKVLPVVQKLFKNSQIFISTHSPFVINSVDDAWVYKLELENGKAKVADVVLSEDGLSYQTVLREIFGIDKRFGLEAQNKLDDFYRQRDSILKANGKGKIKKSAFIKLAKNLASQSAELQSLVFLELARLSKETGEPYEI